jgi:ATP-dependent RNA helicase DeaD
LRDIERYTGQRIEPMKVSTKADVAARRVTLFKETIKKTLAEEELELYLGLVEELAQESGCDMAEVAAAIAYVARQGKPLVVALEPEPEQVPQPEAGMARLFIDAGRRDGVRPGDIVGAIANEAGVPGQAIGAIDIYDRFTFVEVPAQYREQVLARMSKTMIRKREANIRIATPRDETGRSPKQGKMGFGGKKRRQKGRSKKR